MSTCPSLRMWGKAIFFFVHELLWLCGETVCHGKLVNCVKSIGEVGFVGRGLNIETSTPRFLA